MSAPPKTILFADLAEEAAIRAAVHSADVSGLGAEFAVAQPGHGAGLVALLSDPEVSGPIYDLPRPITMETVSAWIHDAAEARAKGERILVVSKDGDGRIGGYLLFTIWPMRASGELGGAERADLQNAGRGKRGLARAVDWMFETLRLRLIGVTAALDNVRSARIIEAGGFTATGRRECMRPDGTVRPSRCWELTREAWLHKAD